MNRHNIQKYVTVPKITIYFFASEIKNKKMNAMLDEVKIVQLHS